MGNMLKDLAKTALIKYRVGKYNKTVRAKLSAYDKWQRGLEKQKVDPVEAPVSYETSESGELIPHKLPEPKVKVVKIQLGYMCEKEGISFIYLKLWKHSKKNLN